MQKKLNFGCGLKILPGFDNADIQKGKGIDYSFDFEKFPYPIKDNTYDYIFVDNVLEHLNHANEVMDELWRIGKDGCKIFIRVPYCRSILAYNDILHVNFFNVRSMTLLLDGYSAYDVNYGRTKRRFRNISVKLRPTFYGKLIPKFLRKYADYLFNEIHDIIEAEVTVNKK